MLAISSKILLIYLVLIPNSENLVVILKIELA